MLQHFSRNAPRTRYLTDCKKEHKTKSLSWRMNRLWANLSRWFYECFASMNWNTNWLSLDSEYPFWSSNPRNLLPFCLQDVRNIGAQINHPFLFSFLRTPSTIVEPPHDPNSFFGSSITISSVFGKRIHFAGVSKPGRKNKRKKLEAYKLSYKNRL